MQLLLSTYNPCGLSTKNSSKFASYDCCFGWGQYYLAFWIGNDNNFEVMLRC